MIASLTEEEIQERHRIDKINYVWDEMTQEEKINAILEFCKIRSIEDAFKDIILDEKGLFDESTRDFKHAFEEIEIDFDMLSEKESVEYLIRHLCLCDDLDEWFQIENETLFNGVFKQRIDQHEWFEVMPYAVISKEELNRGVAEVAASDDEYYKNEIKRILKEVNKSNIEELTDDEKLMIYDCLSNITY